VRFEPRSGGRAATSASLGRSTAGRRARLRRTSTTLRRSSTLRRTSASLRRSAARDRCAPGRRGGSGGPRRARASRLRGRGDDLGDLLQLCSEPLDLVEAVLEFGAVGHGGAHRGAARRARVRGRILVDLHGDHLTVDDVGTGYAAIPRRLDTPRPVGVSTPKVGRALTRLVVLGHVVAAFCSTGAEAVRRRNCLPCPAVGGCTLHLLTELHGYIAESVRNAQPAGLPGDVTWRDPRTTQCAVMAAQRSSVDSVTQQLRTRLPALIGVNHRKVVQNGPHRPGNTPVTCTNLGGGTSVRA
jgi:hypothetical protein